MIEDLEEKKPADWDQLEHFPGPDVKKPDDRDEEMDGKWEPLMISNLDYKEAEKKTKVQEDQCTEIYKEEEKENEESEKETDFIIRMNSNGTKIVTPWL
nr:calreticulin-like [Chelonoidis abingdonii]